MQYTKVAIVGFGRFGKTLYRLLREDFSIVLFNRSPKAFEKLDILDGVTIAQSLQEVLRCEVIFYAVSIGSFETTIREHAPYFTNQLIIDVLSVKQWPKKVFTKYLKNTRIEAILTHPMFGPVSTRHGFEGQRIVMENFRVSREKYEFWKSYFGRKGLEVIEMPAKEHDELVAKTQATTHFMARILNEFGYGSTPIDTDSVAKQREVVEQLTGNSEVLFYDMFRFNPEAQKALIKLEKIFKKLARECSRS
ncbi:prephenate dehydrogenase/arogenate dehydrogenase family protein [Candidatus Roizmanbacteria bacterium]|nr:prephenate dehydrogenase/arogenate dehydrogenase family protein [Candidatus Roizmanbacteria bacterium]